MITELGSSKLYLGNDGDVIRGQGLHDPGLLCPHAFAVEDVVDAGYNDGYRTLHPDVKGYSFPTWDPHVRLDYVFVPRAFRERLQAVEVITEPKEQIRAASDHCPLLGVLATD